MNIERFGFGDAYIFADNDAIQKNWPPGEITIGIGFSCPSRRYFRRQRKRAFESGSICRILDNYYKGSSLVGVFLWGNIVLADPSPIIEPHRSSGGMFNRVSGSPSLNLSVMGIESDNKHCDDGQEGCNTKDQPIPLYIDGNKAAWLGRGIGLLIVCIFVMDVWLIVSASLVEDEKNPIVAAKVWAAVGTVFFLIYPLIGVMLDLFDFGCINWSHLL